MFGRYRRSIRLASSRVTMALSAPVRLLSTPSSATERSRGQSATSPFPTEFPGFRQFPDRDNPPGRTAPMALGMSHAAARGAGPHLALQAYPPPWHRPTAVRRWLHPILHG